jgi:hypothetical protein
MRAWDDDGWEGCSQIASIYDSGSMHERPLDELAGDRYGWPPLVAEHAVRNSG